MNSANYDRHLLPGKEEPIESSSSTESCPIDSSASSTCLDLEDAALSGPLYTLSELMAQLPRRNGLSRYYHGKSQSHSSLGSVKCLDDLPKKEKCSKMKSCQSHGGMNTRRTLSPKSAISKKDTKGMQCSRVFLAGGVGFHSAFTN